MGSTVGWTVGRGPWMEGSGMLDADLRKLLIAQIGNEFAAHALYMGISVYFDRQPDRPGRQAD